MKNNFWVNIVFVVAGIVLMGKLAPYVALLGVFIMAARMFK